MSFDPRLRPAINQCDPYRPLRLELPEELGLYVNLDEVRGLLRRPAGEQLYYLIAAADPLDTTAQLLIGPAGSGKSTEIYRLKRRLELDVEPTVVVRVDLEAWLDLSQPVSLVEVLRILVETMERYAEMPEPIFGLWFDQLLRTHPVLRGEGWDDRPGGAGVILREDLRLRARVSMVLQQQQAEVLRVVDEAMRKAVARLRADFAGRVVLLVDGLDHVRPRREEDRGRLERGVEQLLIEQAIFLHLPCHVVYVTPGWMGDQIDRLQHHWTGGVVPLHLPDLAHHRTHALLLEILDSRIDRFRIFGSDSEGINLILRNSGGHPRDLLRLARAAIERVGRRPPAQLPVSGTEIRLASEQMRSEYQLYARRAGLESVDLPISSRLLFRALDVGLLLWHSRGYERHPLR